MKHLDLFSGIGGFALAAKWAGLETIAFCERDIFCQKILNKHWSDLPCYEDIKTMKGFPCDLITAGFPCQPFSVAGKQKGKDDERYLWDDTIRVIRESQPAWCILENVPGIIPMLDPILEDLESEGYTWQAFLIPASAVHAPHKRERLWIISNRDSERCNIWVNNRKERHVQIDWQQHIASIQSEWSQFKPQSWSSFNAQEWLGFTTDTDSEQCNQRTTNKDGFQDIDAQTHQLQDRESSKSIIFNWQKDQPPIPVVDDGLPNGMDRNKSLGNAIVPQIPFLFMKMIMEIENGN